MSNKESPFKDCSSVEEIFNDVKRRIPRNGPPVIGAEKSANENVLVNWSRTGNNKFVATGAVVEKLPSGLYFVDCLTNDGNPVFQNIDIKVDDIVEIKGGVVDNLMEQISMFMNDPKDLNVFKEIGCTYSRGILMYGPPGSGKSLCVQMLIKKINDVGGISFLCKDPYLFSKGLKCFRELEPDRFVLCIFEDIDSIISEWGEDELLSILDGEQKIDRVINVATTNFPERLDKRIAGRPRRFDRIIKIDNPDESVRREYFKNKLKIDGDELDKWTNETKGLSFAALAEMIISVKCLHIPFDKAVKILNEVSEAKWTSDEFAEKKMGFL